MYTKDHVYAKLSAGQRFLAESYPFEIVQMDLGRSRRSTNTSLLVDGVVMSDDLDPLYADRVHI